MMDAVWLDSLWAGIRDGGRPPSFLTLMWFVGCVWLGSVFKLKRGRILIAVVVSLLVTAVVRFLMHLGLWVEWYVDRIAMQRLQVVEAVVFGFVLAGTAVAALRYKNDGFDARAKNTAALFWPLHPPDGKPADPAWGRTILLVLLGLAGALVSSWIVFIGGFDPVLLRVYRIVASATGIDRYGVLAIYTLASLWPCWMLVFWLVYTPPVRQRELWVRRSMVLAWVTAMALIFSCIVLWAAGDSLRPAQQPCCTAQKTDGL